MTASASGRPGEPEWRIHDHAILRSTGFPWHLVDVLDHPRTASRLDELESCEAALAEVVNSVVDTARAHPGALTGRDSRRLRKALSRRGQLPADLELSAHPALQAALDRYRQFQHAVIAAQQALAQDLTCETAETHQAMVKLASDPALREALWLSSPSMHDRGLDELVSLVSRPQSGRARRLRRQFGGYLQRFAAKNETTSFFGPINYADFSLEPRSDDPVVGPPAQRRAALAHWAVLAIADAIAAQPEVRRHLRPQRSSLLSEVDTAAPRLAGRVLRMDPDTGSDALRLVRAVDGRRSVGELADHLGLPAHRIDELVGDAVHGRSLLLDCRPPITEPDALGWLHTRLQELPAGEPRTRWIATVTRLTAVLTEFAAAPLVRRRELLHDIESDMVTLSDEPVRRGGGEWYADRLVVHEECLGALSPLAWGRHTQERLRQRLAPVMTLFAAEAVARHRALTTAFLTRYPDLANGGSIPLLDLIRADARSAPLPVPATRTPAGQYIESRIAGASAEQPLWIDPAELPAAELGEEPLIGSPDLMFAVDRIAPILDGTAPMVLAECHDTLLLWGWALQFHPDPHRVREHGAELLRRAQAGRSLATVLGSRRAKIVPFDFPGPVVDLGSSPLPADRRRVPLAEITVRLSGARLICSALDEPDFLLHHGELDSTVHNVLAPPKVHPVVFGNTARTPRIVLGDVVVQRARWTVRREELFPAGAELPDPLIVLRHARAAAAQHGLPRRTFLKVPGERKPVLLDLRAPALLDLGWQLSSKADQVVLTELLPGPDQLWLRGRDGRHTCELRTTMVLDRLATRRTR